MTHEQQLAAVAFARSQKGVRWEHQGRKPGVCLDCVGLLVCAGRSLGLSIADWIDYSEHVIPQEMLRFVGMSCERAAAPEAAAVVLFWIRRREEPTHAGLCTGDGYFVHAKRDGVVSESDLAEPFWAKRVHSFWRYT